MSKIIKKLVRLFTPETLHIFIKDGHIVGCMKKTGLDAFKKLKINR